jgi:serine phosphatase RsbU (regulator of sigma subunit)
LPETDPVEYVRDLPVRPPRDLMAGEVLVEEVTEEGRLVWLVLESDTDDRATSTLVVRLSPRVVVDDELGDTTRLVGSIIGRALGRTRVVAVEQARRDSERRLSETLQRSLLSQPVQREGLRVAVSYVPAAEEAQVGGDWYDAFILPNDDLCLVIGDVTGHDRESAAGMAQLRNLLRGVSMTLGEPPAAVMGVLDRAVQQLAIDVIATVIVAQVEHDEGPEGGCRVTWSNAGHPPPALLLPDGSVRLLDAPADPLLGVDGFARHDHTEALVPGSSLVLYTDGLLERRGESMDSGLTWLERALTGQQDLDPEALCKLLIERMPPGVEDDVALLVLAVD